MYLCTVGGGTRHVTGTEGHVVDGPGVAADLLKGPVAPGVPDGHGPVFGARHQEGPGGVHVQCVHLDIKEDLV